MTRHLNITSGIFVSLLIHALVFFNYRNDFGYDKSQAPVQSLARQIQIQLVKYRHPEKKVIASKPFNQHKSQPVTKKLLSKSSLASQVANSNQKKTLPDTSDKKPEETLADKNKFDENDIKKKAVSQEISRAEVIRQQVKVDLQKQRQKERDAYIKRLLAHIEAYKFYPSAARRRAIEGRLEVSFLLQKNGKYAQLSIQGSRGVLQRAVRQAIEDALPFPEPPPSMAINPYIAFNMNYQLE